MNRRYLAIALAMAAAAPAAAQKKQERAPKKAPVPGTAAPDTTIVLSRALNARSIGPAVMGGRVSSIALDPKDPYTFYVGLGTGGVMKTSNAGVTFAPIFEHESVAAIGDVEVAPSDASIVWVATGEGNDRNSVSWGNGVYRSTDGGGSWTRAGLANSKSIARLAISPSDPKTAFAAVLGDLWSPSAERGLYRTTDAGATWTKVLGVPAPNDTRVGAGDVIVDPTDANVVYATLYARQRRPWAFYYGASATDGEKDLGGIYKSVDGGATWHKLTSGLPTLTGRIGLALYAKNPKIAYAVVQSDEGGTQNIDDPYSKRGGVFRSDDAGEHWVRMSALDPRPFYFSQIRVDPQNDQRIYVLGYALHVSEDGGKTWREDRFRNVHPDNHALAIDPAHPSHLLIGNDGGIYQSFDGGAVWDHLNRFAAGEFYRIAVDNSTPYRICGGLQDNTNWVGPSATPSAEGIRNGDWHTITGGDGSYCAFDPTDSNLVYAESQQGYLFRIDLTSGQQKNLRPEPTEGQPGFRFHWMAPLAPSHHDKGVMYYAGNRVFRLTNHGENFTPISPDLSTRDLTKMTAVGSGAEDYGVVFSLAESPRKAGVLWAGTDDGKLWRTDDDGAHWTDLSANLPAPGRGHWINRIEPSYKDVNVAYVAVDAHRDGIYAPLLYRTADGGRTWQNVAGSLPSDGPVRVVREDPSNPDVLYAGTEFALWYSLDRGHSWQKLGGLPTVAVDDIVITPREHDIVIATHGRSLYVIDDARPLAEATPAVLREDLHLFSPAPATARELLPAWTDWGGAQFRGANRPNGAQLTYYIRRFTGDPVNISIADASGRPIANLTGAGTPGLNRVTWDLKPTNDVLTSYGGEGQKYVRPGTYTVTVSYGAAKSTQKLDVKAVPGLETR